jgi:UPF0755 protein
MKRFVVSACIGIVVVVLGVFIASSVLLNRATGNIPPEGVSFEVAQGDSAGVIGRKLQRQGLIRNAFYFKLYSKISGSQNQYKAGQYLIPAGLSTAGTARLLVEGKTILYAVTIPEGRSLRETAAIFEKAGIIDNADSFIRAASNPALLDKYNISGPNAQGFLFPETYMLPKPYPAERLVEKMITTFYRKLADIYPDYINLSIEELNKKVTMAGLVEKEYRAAEEAPIMASVFYNRLNQGIRLESCASVIYVLTEELGRPHPQRIFYSDLEVESPYNVYKNFGLPPSAISNPGTVALNAAFNPAKTNFLFFVVKDLQKGTHQFSTNIAEHNQGYLNYINTYFPKS